MDIINIWNATILMNGLLNIKIMRKKKKKNIQNTYVVWWYDRIKTWGLQLVRNIFLLQVLCDTKIGAIYIIYFHKYLVGICSLDT